MKKAPTASLFFETVGTFFAFVKCKKCKMRVFAAPLTHNGGEGKGDKRPAENQKHKREAADIHNRFILSFTVAALCGIQKKRCAVSSELLREIKIIF